MRVHVALGAANHANHAAESRREACRRAGSTHFLASAEQVGLRNVDLFTNIR